MAIGNSFGATVLSSYGGFWISAGIVFTPDGFNIMGSLQEAAGGSNSMFYDSLGLMLLVTSPSLLFAPSNIANQPLL
jgi:succinate-acetate transporter protein